MLKKKITAFENIYFIIRLEICITQNSITRIIVNISTVIYNFCVILNATEVEFTSIRSLNPFSKLIRILK